MNSQYSESWSEEKGSAVRCLVASSQKMALSSMLSNQAQWKGSRSNLAQISCRNTRILSQRYSEQFRLLRRSVLILSHSSTACVSIMQVTTSSLEERLMQRKRASLQTKYSCRSLESTSWRISSMLMQMSKLGPFCYSKARKAQQSSDSRSVASSSSQLFRSTSSLICARYRPLCSLWISATSLLLLLLTSYITSNHYKYRT